LNPDIQTVYSTGFSIPQLTVFNVWTYSTNFNVVGQTATK